jgi:ribose transport system substrate-binding protein
MVEHLRGKEVPKRISTGEYIATPENMDEPEMKKLLNPKQFE